MAQVDDRDITKINSNILYIITYQTIYKFEIDKKIIKIRIRNVNKKLNAISWAEAVAYLISMTVFVKSADDDYFVSSSCFAVISTQN